MSTRTLFLDEALYAYMRNVTLREPALMVRLREETAQLEMARMQITPEQGQFMTLITQLCGAKNAIEIGTFTGYSALSIANGLCDGGKLIACDISEEWASIAKDYWSQAGVADKIELCLAPAIKTLDALLTEGLEGEFDLAFIDADKQNYQNYFERCLQLLRPGGLIMVDNVFWGGGVADDENQSPDTIAIRNFNQQLVDDGRVDISLVPIGDGITLARKR